MTHAVSQKDLGVGSDHTQRAKWSIPRFYTIGASTFMSRSRADRPLLRHISGHCPVERKDIILNNHRSLKTAALVFFIFLSTTTTTKISIINNNKKAIVPTLRIKTGGTIDRLTYFAVPIDDPVSPKRVHVAWLTWAHTPSTPLQ